VEEEMQTITLSPGVVQDLKETAWQIDLSVLELIDLIVQGATYKNLDTKRDMDRVNKEGLNNYAKVCLRSVIAYSAYEEEKFAKRHQRKTAIGCLARTAR